MKTKDLLIAVGLIAVIVVAWFLYSLQQSVDKLSTSSDNLTTNMTRLQTEYNNLFTSYANLSTNFTSYRLQQSLLQLQNSVTLNSTTAQMQADSKSVADMQTNLKQAQLDIGDLGKSLGAKVDSSNLTTMSNNIASLQSLIAGLSSNLSSLQAQFDALHISTNVPSYPVSQLIGDTNTNAVSYLQPNYLYLTRFQCIQAGALTSIAVWCNTSCNVRVVIYDDMIGPIPQQFLATGSTSFSSTTPSFNSVSISTVNVNLGEYYWLGVITDTTNAIGASLDAGYTLYYANSYSSSSFPNLLRNSVSYTVVMSNVLISGWSN